MSAKTLALVTRYNQRITQVVDMFGCGTARNKAEQSVIGAAIQFYRDTLDITPDGKFVYTQWLEIFHKFLTNQQVLALDKDGVLARLAERVYNCPGLMAFYKEHIDNGTELDRVQLAITIKMAESAISNES